MARVVSAEPEHQLIDESDSSCEQPTPRRFGPRVLGASAVALLLAAAVVAVVVRRTPSGTPSADVGADNLELQQIISQDPHPMCSKPWKGSKKDDCAATKCCAITGYSCWEKEPGTYGCVEDCTPGKGKTKDWTCAMPHAIVPLADVESTPPATLYCFAVYFKEKGGLKQNFELELLQGQYKKKVGIFACQDSDVFSDTDAEIGTGLSTIKVDDVEHNFHVIKRKTEKTWVNTGLFKQVWKAISPAKIAAASWVIKLDPDAVFIPSRLEAVLKIQPVTHSGIYLENCKEVKYGFFGNLEVFSKKAFTALVSSLDSCSSKYDWVKGIKDTKFEPIGEDLFAQLCMDAIGVDKVSSWDTTTDGVCPGTEKWWGQKKNKKFKPYCDQVTTAAIHPFPKPAKFFACLDATMTLGK